MSVVSIIIPIYNGEKYIDRCIKRLLKQTYKKIEIICVPNNCTDKSVELCKTWEQKDNRVKVFVNEEKGTSLARKRGVLESGGDYIVFMDCDDQYVSDTAIQNMVNAIKEDQTSICQFDYIVQYPIQFLRRKIRVVKEKRIYQRGEMLQGPFLGAVQGRGGDFNCSVWSKIYESKVLKSAVKNVQESLTCGDDMQLNLYAFADENIKAVSGRKEAYYVYRVGRGITTDPNAIFTLLRDYQVTKMQIYEAARNLDVDEQFFNHLWSEVLYCLRDAVYSCLYRKMDKEAVIKLIDEINGYNYMHIAKAYYQQIFHQGWLDTAEGENYLLTFEHEQDPERFRFMCSNFTGEEYYNWCVSNLPKQSRIEKVKKFIRRFA